MQWINSDGTLAADLTLGITVMLFVGF